MRKTIRRGIFVTATAACALGFGLFQASAAPAPTVPSVPELPLGGLTSLSNLGNGLTLAPTMPTLPMLPDESPRSLPGSDFDLAGFGDLLTLTQTTDQLGAGELTDLGDVDSLTEAADLPETDGLLPTDLPTGDLGVPSVAPSELPVGLDTSALPALPEVPSETNEITKAPIVDLPQTNPLPLVAQVDHNNVTQKLIPNTDGVDVQGLPKPEVPNLASSADAVKLPAAAPHTPGMQSVGLPQQLPVVSAVDTPEVPSVHDVTGDLDLPAELPNLPAV